jgi:metallo-beta-lactamase class B
MKKLFPLALFFLCITYFCPAQSRKKLKLKITPLTSEIYVHTSYKMLGGAPFPSNGLIVNTTDGVVLIDTGWGEKPTRQLLEWIEENLRQPVAYCIVTHSHDDRLGGIEVLRNRNIRVLSTRPTATKAVRAGFPSPEGILPADTTFKVGDTTIRTYYPGPGHTRENITVWFPQEKVLFGGCLVKSNQAKDLGNIADADLYQWPFAIRRLKAVFSDTEVVVPGHQSWNSTSALQHTLDLLDAHK